jgi:hypothetical protein
MAITVKEALARYGISAEEFNAAFNQIVNGGLGSVSDTISAFAVLNTFVFADKSDEATDATKSVSNVKTKKRKKGSK